MELGLNLTEEERLLLVALLERESRDLHPELRRSRTDNVREQLHARLELVERLLSRLLAVGETAHVGD